MRTKLCRFVAFGFLAITLLGCATSNRSNAWRQGTTTIKVSGMLGVRITGFYVQDGRRHEIAKSLPFTLTETGLAEVEIRKVNVDESIILDVRYDAPERGFSVADALAGSGIPGIRIQLKNGFSVEHLKK